jgi:hypothetical protein
MLRVIIAFVLTASAAACSIAWEGDWPKVFVDMHDGDEKMVSITNSPHAPGDYYVDSDDVARLTIVPHGNDQAWVVEVELYMNCTAQVNFNVPGKPSPPPVPLHMTLYKLESAPGVLQSLAMGFTDPSITIARTPIYPLNCWLELVDPVFQVDSKGREIRGPQNALRTRGSKDEILGASKTTLRVR